MRFGRSRSKLPLAGTFNAFCFGADNQFVARGLEISAQNTTEVTPRAQSDDGQAKAAASLMQGGGSDVCLQHTTRSSRLEGRDAPAGPKP
jgi:hypothetical protein